MNYRVLIFISKNRLAAVNVDKSGNAENISLEGNTEIEYSTTDDINTFCQYIKDYFNIDNFCDIDLSIFILNFSAAQSMVNYLFDSFNTVNSLNVINANLALPIFALKYFNIQPDTCYNISAFRINHQIFVDNTCICRCKEVNDAEIERELALGDYINLFEFCCSEIIEDESISNELIEDYQKEISKLNSEKQELLAKIKNLEETKETDIDASREKICELILQLEKIKQNKSRSFYRFESQKATSTSTELIWPLTTLLGTVTYYIKYISNDGNLIKQGDTICEVIKQISGEKINSFLLKAETTGRVFHIYKNGCEVKDGDCVAIIGADYDTRAEAMAWYEENK